MLSNCQSASSSRLCGSDDVAGVYCKGDVITGIIYAILVLSHDMQVDLLYYLWSGTPMLAIL
jgi:type III secretory pathway component EscV